MFELFDLIEDNKLKLDQKLYDIEQHFEHLKSSELEQDIRILGDYISVLKMLKNTSLNDFTKLSKEKLENMDLMKFYSRIETLCSFVRALDNFDSDKIHLEVENFKDLKIYQIDVIRRLMNTIFF